MQFVSSYEILSMVCTNIAPEIPSHEFNQSKLHRNAHKYLGSRMHHCIICDSQDLAMVVHALNPCTQQAESGGS
jgi:hypothetical protein